MFSKIYRYFQKNTGKSALGFRTYGKRCIYCEIFVEIGPFLEFHGGTFTPNLAGPYSYRMIVLFSAYFQLYFSQINLPLNCCFEAIAIFSSRSSMGLSCPSRSLSGSHSLCKAFSSNRSKIGYIVCGNSMETGKMFSKYLQPRLPRSYNFC